MEETTLTVRGMTCQGCVNSVTNALRRVVGVTEAQVSLADAKALVRYDASQADVGKLKAAVEAAGFDVN